MATGEVPSHGQRASPSHKGYPPPSREGVCMRLCTPYTMAPNNASGLGPFTGKVCFYIQMLIHTYIQTWLKEHQLQEGYFHIQDLISACYDQWHKAENEQYKTITKLNK